MARPTRNRETLLWRIFLLLGLVATVVPEFLHRGRRPLSTSFFCGENIRKKNLLLGITEDSILWLLERDESSSNRSGDVVILAAGIRKNYATVRRAISHVMSFLRFRSGAMLFLSNSKLRRCGHEIH